MENTDQQNNNDGQFRRRDDHDLVVDTKTRVAVLEKIAENHENRISDMEDFHRAVVERLDQKIQMDSTNQIIIERTLTKAVMSIDSLSENLKSALEVANTASKLASKHETIGYTVVKISIFIGTIAAGLWAVFSFFFGGP
jgi:glutamate synthase domain-containing protein 2